MNCDKCKQPVNQRLSDAFTGCEEMDFYWCPTCRCFTVTHDKYTPKELRE